METTNDDLVVPFLPDHPSSSSSFLNGHEPAPHDSLCNSILCRHGHKCWENPSSFTIRRKSADLAKVQHFQKTARFLQLDHSHVFTSIISWSVGLLLVVIVPVLRLLFIKATSDDSSHQLVFQSVVVTVGVAQSTVSFLFLSHAIRRHGIRGVLFLDALDQEPLEVQQKYEDVITKGRVVLARLFIPVFFMFVCFRIWFFTDVSLEPLPFEETTTAKSLTVIILLTSLSWIFQTTTYLYTCILFSTVCGLQEAKMQMFKEILRNAHDPEYYYNNYSKIIQGLRATSRRFRLFLALILTIGVSGFLASLYKVVAAQHAGINILMSGEIVVLNLVSLVGVWICLSSASKLSHLHRRIVKAATVMHARETFISTESIYLGQIDNVTSKTWLYQFCRVQNNWSRRSALVRFLTSSSVGISVYGFVLDRFFIHASVGALLTTTWFILGRAL